MSNFWFRHANQLLLSFLKGVVIPFLKRQTPRTENQIDDDLVDWLSKTVDMLEAKL